MKGSIMGGTSTGSVRKRATALVGALALSVAGVVVSASSAWATDPNFGNINQSALGSITIHKYSENKAGSGGPDGTLPTGVGNPLVATFTVYPVSTAVFDPSSPSSWDAWSGTDGKSGVGASLATEANCTAAQAGTDSKFGVGKTATTDKTTGAAPALTGLALGGYLVCETTPPEGAVATAAPFVVTLPTPYNGKWIYDVHAFPKNAVNVVNKSVNTPSGLGLGSTVTFPVTTVIQNLPDNKTYTSFVVSDTLDSRLTPISVSVVKVGASTLTRDTDYTVTTNGQRLDVTIDVSKINGSAGSTVEVDFAGVVASLGEDGVISNTATLYANDPDKTNGVDSNSVKTNWGDLKIAKRDSSDHATGLGGAQFEVYASADPYAGACTSKTTTGSAISVNGESTFTSKATGAVDIPGLFVSDSVNPTINALQRCYVVKEVKAPAGYVTPTGNDALTAVAVKTGVTSGFDLTLYNTKQEVPSLPLTGGSGEIALTGGGAGLVLVALVVAVAANRRRKQNA